MVGVGGVFSGDDAWRMLGAGASLLQIYTGFVYGGPLTVPTINRRLVTLMQQEGLEHISERIGRALVA